MEYSMLPAALRFCGAATLYEMHRGNFDAARGYLWTLVKLVAEQKPEPLMVCQIARDGCANVAFDTTWQALQAPGWNDTQFAALQAAWEGCDFPKDMGLAMEMERALTFDFFEQIKSSNAKLAFAANQRDTPEAMYSKPMPELRTHGLVLRAIHLPFWRALWADQDELHALARWQVMIRRERLVRTSSWAALSGQPRVEDEFGYGEFMGTQSQADWYDGLRFLFSCDSFSIDDSFQIDDGLIRRAVCAQVQQQMAITAIAIQRYRLQTGILPADMAALVPKYLSSLPRDGMDGKTLRYKLKEDGGFVLYSVGLDGKDDGGSNKPLHKIEYNTIWDCQDAVWPEPATDQEALAAMESAKD